MTALIGVLAFSAGPSIEAAAFPIVRAATSASSVDRDEHVMRWTTYFEKGRAAVPVYFDYLIVSRGRPIPVAVYKANTRRAYTSATMRSPSHG